MPIIIISGSVQLFLNCYLRLFREAAKMPEVVCSPPGPGWSLERRHRLTWRQSDQRDVVMGGYIILFALPLLNGFFLVIRRYCVSMHPTTPIITSDFHFETCLNCLMREFIVLFAKRSLQILISLPVIKNLYIEGLGMIVRLVTKVTLIKKI